MLLGSLTALPFTGEPLDDPNKSTSENEMGPFYKKGAPTTMVPTTSKAKTIALSSCSLAPQNTPSGVSCPATTPTA